MKTRIVRSFATLLLLAAAPLAAQGPATVTGRVTDDAGAPVAAALVRIEALGVGANTTPDGTYRLVVPEARIRPGEEVKLAVSRVGYATRSATLRLDFGAQLVQHFVLSSDVLLLDEVVVSGSGTTRQRAVLGAAVAGVTPGAAPGAAGARAPWPYQRTQDVPSTAPRAASTESYAPVAENAFRSTRRNPLSTFSIDVDAAAYTNVRRFLEQGGRPPADAVRIEEMLNYFDYDYPDPGAGEHPFAVVTEVGPSPWSPENRLVQVGLQGRRVPVAGLPPSNLVFLIDVSGSMAAPEKLPLVRESLRMLVAQLRPHDRVALVVYAGAAGVVLEPTPGDRKDEIVAALGRLEAGGSTAGGAGLRLAYEVARRSHLPGGNNRVILATDGDFNVGVSSDAEMFRLIEEKREEGTFLTVLGFGMGNLKDSKLEGIADRGNGHYAYIDNLREAERVLVREAGGTLFTIAKDVKLQVEFNPRRVAAYRLIGYENRLLAAEDFDDDRKDAGELGAGHSVTALYEIVPRGARGTPVREAPPLRYQREGGAAPAARGEELLYVKLRYKRPEGGPSRFLAHAVREPGGARGASDDFRFAAAVASFGMLLRGSEHRGESSVEGVLALARGALGPDPHGERAGFVRLVERFREVEGRGEGAELAAR